MVPSPKVLYLWQSSWHSSRVILALFFEMNMNKCPLFALLRSAPNTKFQMCASVIANWVNSFSLSASTWLSKLSTVRNSSTISYFSISKRKTTYKPTNRILLFIIQNDSFHILCFDIFQRKLFQTVNKIQNNSENRKQRHRKLMKIM